MAALLSRWRERDVAAYVNFAPGCGKVDATLSPDTPDLASGIDDFGQPVIPCGHNSTGVVDARDKLGQDARDGAPGDDGAKTSNIPHCVNRCLPFGRHRV